MKTESGIELDRPEPEDPSHAIWIEEVKRAAVRYRKAQNEASDASDALTGAISAARAAGIPVNRVLSEIAL